MSIFYRLFFTVFMMSMGGPAAAQEKPDRMYRVELIVLRHLSGSSDSTPQAQLRDLTELLDLYTPVDPNAPAQEPDSLPEAGSIGPDLAAEAEADAPPAIRVEDMSEAIRDAWKRLRGSAGFRPELFRAWEQSGDQPFSRLRIHDEEVLFSIEPDALLDAVVVDEHGAPVFSDATLQLEQDGAIAGPKGSGHDGASEAGDGPPTQVYYRIDGSARLTRARFLNLDLDIELREPLYGEQVGSDNNAGEAVSNNSESMELQTQARVDQAESLAEGAGQKVGPAADATAFRIHHIAQRRQVKAGQMEYFDGPVIGILALVTGFDAIAEEAPMDDALPVE